MFYTLRGVQFNRVLPWIWSPLHQAFRIQENILIVVWHGWVLPLHLRISGKKGGRIWSYAYVVVWLKLRFGALSSQFLLKIYFEQRQHTVSDFYSWNKILGFIFSAGVPASYFLSVMSSTSICEVHTLIFLTQLAQKSSWSLLISALGVLCLILLQCS